MTCKYLTQRSLWILCLRNRVMAAKRQKIIYRAVSIAEWNDIQTLNRFRGIENTYEGKLFVENKEDALFFQEKFMRWDNITYIVVEITIDLDIYNLFAIEDADARVVLAVDRDSLTQFNQSVISIKQI